MLRPGVNHLSIEVTNTWFNRLVYDAQPRGKCPQNVDNQGPSKDRALVPAAYWARCLCGSARSWALKSSTFGTGVRL